MGRIKIYNYKSLDSTNDEAKKLITSESEYIIYTKKQKNGRGQYDRKWLSKNGLTFSIVLKKENSNYSSIVPIAIKNYFKEKGIEVTIKQPNDIYYNNKKLGGILVENVYCEDKYDKTIIGIGLNINEDKIIENKVENAICINIDEDDEIIMQKIYEEIINITKEVNKI